MAGVKILTSTCPRTGRPCRRRCGADSIAHAGAMIEPHEEFDRDVERQSPKGSRAEFVARQHRQDRLDRLTADEVRRNPTSCPER